MVRKSPKRESILTEIEREDSSDHHSRDSLLPISNPDRTSNQRRCLADLRITLKSTPLIMVVQGAKLSPCSLLAFQIGICLREKLPAAAISAAGFEFYSFSSSFHVS
ncbi:hypothetical protein NC652_038330 [Populus alba x Populus x berolinensis]|nr:hypothetical protein NC652_038330 [Populus alba x Populus x berolinensis]